MRTEWCLFALIGLVACGHKAPPPGKPDTTPPEVRLVHPPDGVVLQQGDTVAFVFEAVDSSEVVRAVVRVGGQTVAADSTPPLELLWVVDTAVFHPAAETLELTLEVWDYWDNVARISRKIVVTGVQPAGQQEGKDEK